MIHPVLNFLMRVHIRTDDCWEWLGGRKEFGYGRSSWSGKVTAAHRAMYELVYGNLPIDMDVMHACDNTWCVNPSHLSLGTHHQNMADMARKGRSAKGTGHPSVKLSEADVIAIRRDSRSTRRIASDYAITSTTVSAIKNFKKWAHIPA